MDALSEKGMLNMKKIRLLSFLLLSCLLWVLFPAPISAKETRTGKKGNHAFHDISVQTVTAKSGNVKTSEKKKMSKLVKALDNFVFYSLERYFLQNPQKQSCTVKMDGQAMMTAAAVSTDYWKNKIVKDRSVNGDGYIIYKLSSAKLKKRCKNLFGKTVSVSKLRKKRRQQDTWSLYQKSGMPYLYCVTTENDTDLVRKSLSVKKNGSSYTVTEKMYLGHWGMSDTADPNYAITFQMKKSAVSSFGYVVKGKRVKQI